MNNDLLELAFFMWSENVKDGLTLNGNAELEEVVGRLGGTGSNCA